MADLTASAGSTVQQQVAGLFDAHGASLYRFARAIVHTQEDAEDAVQGTFVRLLDERPVDRLRTAHAILKLTRKVVPHRLEAACARALAFDDVAYATIKRILDRGLDHVPLPGAAAAVLVTSTAPLRFVRPASDFFPVPA